MTRISTRKGIPVDLTLEMVKSRDHAFDIVNEKRRETDESYDYRGFDKILQVQYGDLRK